MLRPMQQRIRPTILLLSILLVFSGSGFFSKNLFFFDHNSNYLPENFPANYSQTEGDPDEDICGLHELECDEPSPSLEKNVEIDLLRAENAKINIIFFWMQDCAHCTEMLDSTLPEMYLIFGEQIYFYPIELKDIEEIDVFYRMAERLGVSKNNIGVPLMIVGDQVLAGNQINSNLEKSIVESRSAPDYSFIAIPEFEERLPEFLRSKQMNINPGSRNQSGNNLSLRTTFPFAIVIGLPMMVIVGVFIAVIYKKSKQI